MFVYFSIDNQASTRYLTTPNVIFKETPNFNAMNLFWTSAA